MITMTDNDRHFGPVTYGRVTWRCFSIELRSGNEDYPGANLTVYLLGWVYRLALPQWVLHPERKKVYPGWDALTIERLGRDWYWDITERSYGFSIADEYIHIHHGRQSMDSSTEQTTTLALPWRQWRHVRYSCYDRDGNEFWTGKGWDADAVKSCPCRVFTFVDFDGENIQAKTRIEEREWRWGEKHFKWLSLFRKPRIQRALDIDFSSEVGPGKRSWKGGTLGHGTSLLSGEGHRDAFIRYCGEHKLQFVAELPEARIAVNSR